MHKLIIAAALAIAPLVTVSVQAASAKEAACTTQPASKWIGKTAAKANAEKLGYKVRSVKVENNCYDVFAIDKSGKHTLAVMNPITGKIVNNENESN